MTENGNDKKRFGRRAGFGVAALIILQVAFYFCMFRFSDPEIGLKWWLFNAGVTSIICGVIAGVLTVTDIKQMIVKK